MTHHTTWAVENARSSPAAYFAAPYGDPSRMSMTQLGPHLAESADGSELAASVASGLTLRAHINTEAWWLSVHQALTGAPMLNVFQKLKRKPEGSALRAAVEKLWAEAPKSPSGTLDVCGLDERLKALAADL